VNELTKDQIRAWLALHKRDRKWLADQMNVSPGTVDQWFAERGFSDSALATIKLLMDRDLETPSNDTGLIQFTTDEFERIERARQRLGYTERPPFYRDAILKQVESIEAEMPTLPVNASISYLKETPPDLTIKVAEG
jgi:hypothetical protein